MGEYALKFDGMDDFVNCGNTDAVNVTGAEITLEAWIKPKRWKENKGGKKKRSCNPSRTSGQTE